MEDDVCDPTQTDCTQGQPEYFEDSDSGSEEGSINGDDGGPTNVAVNGATQNNFKEGELSKQGGVKRNQGWKRRYMRFDGKSLKYYKNRNTPVSLRIIPIGIMLNVQPLNEGRRSSTSSLFSFARAHQFELECVNRTFQFGTDDLNNAQQWESFLMAAIIDHKKNGAKLSDGGEMCNPDMCGSIKFDKNGKKYFVAIKRDKFRYYYNEKDYRIDCPIHELSMKLSSVKVLEPTKLQLSSAPNQKFILNFESADEATQWEMEIQEATEEALGDNEALENVTELLANQSCADCSSSRVQWASINFGITLCAKCAGIHRSFGATVSKVRSLRMDEIFMKNKALLQMFQAIGNKNANEFWCKRPPSGIIPTAGMCVDDRKIHLTRKYLKRVYADTQRNESGQLNKDFLAAVRVNDIQNAMTCVFSGAEIAYRGEDGKTAVAIAESLGHTILKEFLEQNENIVLPTLFGPANGHGTIDIVSNSLDPDETPSYSASHPDPSCLHILSHSREGSEWIQIGSVRKKTAIYYEGYLEKTGPNMRGYLKRWFVLHYGILSYYQERGKSSPKGKINIKDDIVSVSSSHVTDREHVFEIGCKVNRRVFRFAAPDAESRIAWMSALVKVVCPTEILPEQIEECSTLTFAGIFYIKSEQGAWRRAWITLRGVRLDIWNTDDMTHCLTISITRDVKLFKYNSGRSSKLLDTMDDFRILDGNQCIEIVKDTKLTKFQGILLKDTDKMFAYVDKMLTKLEKR